MTAIFKNVYQWFNRLTYSQKFSIITVIFVAPVLAFVPFFISQVDRIDRYGTKEAVGAQYIRILWRLSEDSKTHTANSYDYFFGSTKLETVVNTEQAVEDDLAALEQFDTQQQTMLGLGSEPTALRVLWQQTKEAVSAGDVESFKSNQRQFSETLTALSLKVGDTSNLILDPDLDTYYLMDTVLLKLPDNQELSFEAWRIVEEAVYRKELTEEDQIQLSILAGRLEANLDTMKRNITVAAQNDTNVPVDFLISGALAAYEKELLAFTKIIKNDVLNTDINKSSVQALGLLVQAQYAKVHDSDGNLYSATSATLERGIENRASRLSNQLVYYSMIAVASVVVAFSIGQSVMRSISEPLTQLAEATRQLSLGQLNTRVATDAAGEIGQVGAAFNQMAIDLEREQRELVMRSTERDRALAQSEKRTQDLQVIGEISKIISSEQRLGTLLPLIAQNISEKLGFYHVGIFLLDEPRTYAVLVASNSAGGRRMVEREHKLGVGQSGIVGYVSATGKTRIALDVGSDAVFFNNPDLPNTRSEMALPLRVAGVIIGVLDVQSIESNAFQEEDIDTLATLADQVAIAIQNARTYESLQSLLTEARRTSSSLLQESWRTLTQEQAAVLGYQASESKLTPLAKPLGSEQVHKALALKSTVQKDGEKATLVVPIRLRDRVIGVLDIQVPDEHNWDQDDVDLAEAVAERLSLSLEASLLLKATQRRAEIERLTAEISTRIGTTSQFDSILQTAAEELSRALGGSEVLVQLQPDAWLKSEEA